MSELTADQDPSVDFTAVDSMIDFDLGVKIAGGLMRPGPKVTAAQAHQVVAELKDDAVASTRHVAEVTGLRAEPGRGVLVVDRKGWVQANADSFRTILAPAVSQALANRPSTNAAVLSISRKATAGEFGTLLSFVGTRVLGQYDIAGGSEPDSRHASAGIGGGRLLLVAPNIVHVERELEVNEADFRLWVCLHEETHRVQFTANPWLRDHLLGSSRKLVTDLLGLPGELSQRLGTAAKALPELIKSGGAGSVLDLIQTPEQKRQLAQLTATMSLLEGHADVVMDEAGPAVIPTVEQIRTRFNSRRQGAGVVDKLLRRLLGLEAKMRQYRDGAHFVRGVIDEVGMEGFNRVWDGPQTLPMAEEILDPVAWVRRVHA